MKFSRDKLLEGELIKTRSAREFEKRYLRKGYSEKILILRVLDSKREKFNLGIAYRDKIKVENIITAPEIEMLIICREKKYAEYKKSKKKPSDFCKDDLKMGKIKEKGFVKEYFFDVNELIEAIKEYRRIAKVQNNEYTLYDLLI